MRVLVTGGAGFIGSHLCEALLKNDEVTEVICMDNLACANESNIKHLKKNSKFRFINQDIVNMNNANESNIECDYIMHFASRPSPIDYVRDPVPTMLVGSFGTYNMLELARKNKCEIMFASTSEVYGDPLEHPQKETYWGNVNCIGPRACYDESKRFSEALMFSYHRQYNVKIKIIRIFNTYGPRMRKDDGRIVPAFISQALKNQDLTIFGDGKQTRSFCYVSDLVSGIIKFMELKQDYTGPINLGNPDEYTVVEFAEIIKKLTKSNSTLVFRDLPKDDPARRRPDITLAKKVLKWKPEISLEQGLKNTIEWFKEN